VSPAPGPSLWVSDVRHARIFSGVSRPRVPHAQIMARRRSRASQLAAGLLNAETLGCICEDSAVCDVAGLVHIVLDYVNGRTPSMMQRIIVQDIRSDDDNRRQCHGRR
jgi:hypothetical protein